MQNLEYFIVLGVCGIIPFLYNFHPSLGFAKNHKFALLSIIVSALPFLVWDIYATFAGHWGFNYNYVIGLKIFNLPLEEILFFVVVPYCCLHVWNVIEKWELTKTTFINLYKKIIHRS